MVNHKESDEMAFTAPGGGSWELESLHFPRPATRYLQETLPTSYKRGTADYSQFFGLLSDGEEIAFVNGFAYVRELAAPETALPQRFKRAEEVLAGKLWHEQLEAWDKTVKPAAIAKHRKLQAVDPNTLSDKELIGYLVRCRDHHAAMIAQHHRLTGSSLIPIGDFLAQVGDWTGLHPSEILELTRGSARLSAGSSEELERIKTVFSMHPAAKELLNSNEAAAYVLETLRARKDEVGIAVVQYLDSVGCRILDGFDIDEPLIIEVPDALLRSLKAALAPETQSTFDFGARIGEIRAKVPPEHKAEFAELLGEVRIIYRLRDERGIYSDIWAAGLMRRAALAAGRRVAERGRIAHPELMLEASLDEMCALVVGTAAPSLEELANRAQYRAAHTAKDAPHFLGTVSARENEVQSLPPAIARLTRAYSISMSQQFRASHDRNKPRVVYGLAASRGVYEGTARRVSSTLDFDRLLQGDVLITESTTEAFNIVIPLLGAIVTDDGGLLSHAAIVSREYGIPGVVGTRDATRRIHDGSRVRVDADAGVVTVLR